MLFQGKSIPSAALSDVINMYLKLISDNVPPLDIRYISCIGMDEVENDIDITEFDVYRVLSSLNVLKIEI